LAAATADALQTRCGAGTAETGGAAGSTSPATSTRQSGGASRTRFYTGRPGCAGIAVTAHAATAAVSTDTADALNSGRPLGPCNAVASGPRRTPQSGCARRATRATRTTGLTRLTGGTRVTGVDTVHSGASDITIGACAATSAIRSVTAASSAAGRPGQAIGRTQPRGPGVTTDATGTAATTGLTCASRHADSRRC
jgi:hypothetical protein